MSPGKAAVVAAVNTKEINFVKRTSIKTYTNFITGINFS